MMTTLHPFWRRFGPMVGLLACFVATPATFVAAPATQSPERPERYTAMAVNMGAPVRWTTMTVEMVVNRWSTDAERDRLFRILSEQGPEELLDALQEIPRVGYIRTPDSIGYDLHFARKIPGEDGGERVILATDRYITFWEAANRPRTIDYPFTVVELRIGPNGEGEGKMSLFTKVVLDKRHNTVVLEDYGTQPALLQGVKKERPSN
jgi:hypothetical protein